MIKGWGVFAKAWAQLWLKLWILGLLTLSWFRLGFWFWNRHELGTIPVKHILLAGGMALRGDLAGVAYIWGPSFVGLFGGLWIKRPRVRLFFWFFFTAFVLFWVFFINSLDVVFFSHLGERFHVGHFYILKEIQVRDLDALRLYPAWIIIQFMAWSGCLLFLIQWSRHYLELSLTCKPILKLVEPFSVFLLGIALFVIAARGGFQVRPLKVSDFISPKWSFKQTQLLLNTPFVMVQAIQDHWNEKVSPNWSREATWEFFQNPPWKKVYPHRRHFEGKNVVLLVVESLSSSFLRPQNGGQSQTVLPHIWKISQRPDALTLNPIWALGRRTVEGLAALWLGLPAWEQPPLIYRSVKIPLKLESLPALFRQKGYYTIFYHGAPENSLNIHKSAELLGFQEVLHLDNYPDPNQYDGAWGIPDHLYLSWAVNDLDHRPEPFFATILTLSSHYPYRIPQLPAGTLKSFSKPFEQALHYGDYSVGIFFQRALQKAWGQRTLFIITGDHVGEIQNKPVTGLNPQDYAVPLIFVNPGYRWNFLGKIQGPVSQWDLKPTLVDWFKLTDQEYHVWGYPLDQVEAPRYVIYRWHNCVWIVHAQGIWDSCQNQTDPQFFKLWEAAWNFYQWGLWYRDMGWPKKLVAKPLSGP